MFHFGQFFYSFPVFEAIPYPFSDYFTRTKVFETKKHPKYLRVFARWRNFALEKRSKFFINIANLTNSEVLLRDEATLFLFLKVFLFLAAKGAGVGRPNAGERFSGS